MNDQNATAFILIVEDSLGVAHAFQRALGLYQDGLYQVRTCDSGESALKLLHETPFDLLISDIRLPGIDGLELVERARRIRPGIRTIFITAYGSPEVEARARELANAYIVKPFRLQEFIGLVERVLTEPAPIWQPITKPRLGYQGIADVEIETGKRKNAHLIVLAFDVDGTLAEEGVVAPRTWEMLRSAKMAGLILILVTGRTLDSLAIDLPNFELCEAIVAENGAVVYFPHRDAVILPFGQVDPIILKRLNALSIPFERGMAIAATQIPHDKAIMEALRENRIPAVVEYNRDAVMVLPPGVTKGSGLLAALQELGYSPHNVIACGDAENDRSMLEVAEHSVAVSNAQPALKTIADSVLSQPDGAGIQTLIQDLLDGQLPSRTPRHSQQLLLGYRMSGAPLHLDPFILIENNVGVFGSTGSGKSWLGGLLVEELLKQKYQVCIIDPEGEYRGLGTSPHTLLLGGESKPLPPVTDLLNIIEWNNISLVLDLSMYSLEDRIDYVTKLIPMLRGLRTRRGRPHLNLVDEIQIFCPTEGGLLTELFLEAMHWGGFSLISYRLTQVAPALLGTLDHWLITRMNLVDELKTLQPHLACYEDGDNVIDQLRKLPKGQACLFLGSTKQRIPLTKDVIKFRVGARTIPHIRHLHKYLRAPLPESKRFYFHDPGGRYLSRAAANLWEFREALSEVAPDSLKYHLERGDFDHWLREVLHDGELSRRVHNIVTRDLSGEALRLALLEVVIERYEELEALV